MEKDNNKYEVKEIINDFLLGASIGFAIAVIIISICLIL